MVNVNNVTTLVLISFFFSTCAARFDRAFAMDYISVDNLVEDHLTAKPANEYDQSCDKDEGEMRGREQRACSRGYTSEGRARVHMERSTKR